MIKLKVKWALSVKIITGITLALIIICEYYLIRSLIYSIEGISLIIACFIPVITFYFALKSPSSIEMNETGIALHKLRGRLVIDYDRITDIAYYKPDCSEIRLFGSGGFFGYIGTFKNATTGRYQAYVGDYSDSFLIKTKENKNYVLSCENRDLVINTIKMHIKP
jgi:hypothetical protein